jgi:hypothetical protein
MRNIFLTLALAGGTLALAPNPAPAQFLNPLIQQRAVQRQIINWFQGYLGRLPTAQELATLTNQYMLSGNALAVQSVILASNEFFLRSGGTIQGFLNRLFLTTLGRQPTYLEIAQLQPQVFQNGRLWFTRVYLSQIAGGWSLNNWNTAAVAAVPVPVVVPIIIR